MKILNIVDYQWDFADPFGALYVPGGETIAEAIIERQNSGEYDIIVRTFDSHSLYMYEGSEEQKSFPSIHCEHGTIGWELYKHEAFNSKSMEAFRTALPLTRFDLSLSAFNERALEIFVGKSMHDVWQTESFPALIDTLLKEPAEVDVCGLTLDVCVKLNAMGWAERGHAVTMLRDATKTISEPYDSVCRDIEAVYNSAKFAK